MRSPAAWARPRLDGLAVRVGAFLTVALLPVGLIALYQTREFQQETQERAGLSLLAATASQASGVQQALERALGAADALGAVKGLLDDPAACTATLGPYVAKGGTYAFVGFLPAEGPVTCSSASAPFELRDRADMADLMARPRPRVRANESGAVSGQDVLVVVAPLMERAGYPGYVGLSVPREGLAPSPPAADRPLRHVTFNADGMVLTEQGAATDAATEAPLADLLPEGRDLAGEAGGAPRVFAARDGSGVERVYTVTPLLPGVAYAMGIWSPEQGALAVGPLARAPLLFPLLMWAVSLLVAFVAINRMVIRPVAALGADMRRFGRDRALPPAPGRDAPRELREIGVALRHTAEEILHDEARMEEAFRERGVLLREVHHRVKNNLQLISSIISMQARRSPDPAMRRTLRRLQDRVLTLATIYRQLYTSEDMGDVDAADALRAVARQETGGRPGGLPGGVALDLDLQPLAMVPDQVVPLAFLAAEALANAVADAGTGPARIVMSLKAAAVDGGPGARFCIENERPDARSGDGADGAPPEVPGAADGARGLGTHLIRAFAAQLGGPVEMGAAGRTYRVCVAFPLHAVPTDDAADDPPPGPAPGPPGEPAQAPAGA